MEKHISIKIKPTVFGRKIHKHDFVTVINRTRGKIQRRDFINVFTSCLLLIMLFTFCFSTLYRGEKTLPLQRGRDKDEKNKNESKKKRIIMKVEWRNTQVQREPLRSIITCKKLSASERLVN